MQPGSPSTLKLLPGNLHHLRALIDHRNGLASLEVVVFRIPPGPNPNFQHVSLRHLSQPFPALPYPHNPFRVSNFAIEAPRRFIVAIGDIFWDLRALSINGLGFGTEVDIQVGAIRGKAVNCQPSCDPKTLSDSGGLTWWMGDRCYSSAIGCPGERREAGRSTGGTSVGITVRSSSSLWVLSHSLDCRLFGDFTLQSRQHQNMRGK